MGRVPMPLALLGNARFCIPVLLAQPGTAPIPRKVSKLAQPGVTSGQDSSRVVGTGWWVPGGGYLVGYWVVHGRVLGGCPWVYPVPKTSEAGLVSAVA